MAEQTENLLHCHSAVLAHNKQVVKVICHKTASPPQMDGSIVFGRWRQCTLPRGHNGATWRLWLYLFPSDHRSVQSKQ